MSQSPNWIHPAFMALSISKSLGYPLTQSTLEKMDTIIDYWKRSDKSRDNPRQLIQLFGDGLALFITLPEDLKERTNVYVFNALNEAAAIANRNRIRVTFDSTGPIFS